MPDHVNGVSPIPQSALPISVEPAEPQLILINGQPIGVMFHGFSQSWAMHAGQLPPGFVDQERAKWMMRKTIEGARKPAVLDA